MSNLYVELIMNVIKFLYMLEALYIMNNIKIERIKKGVFLIIYIGGYVMLESDAYQAYIIRCIYFLFIFALLYKDSKISKKLLVSNICVYLSIFEMINLFGSVVGTIIANFLKYPIINPKISTISIQVPIKIILIYLVLRLLRENKISINRVIVNECLTYFMYFLVVCAKIPFLYTDIRDAFEWKVIFLTIICCSIIFLIISKMEKHNVEQEIARIEENNKILSTKLHKSREILPAMVQILNSVTEHNGEKMDEQEAHKLLEEVNDLYEQQIKENNKEDVPLRSFCSTGLRVLDQQLSFYQREAIDKDVNFDIYVQAPINELLKKDDIDQLRLQRALGDLVRNAFRSLEREDKKCRVKGHILLIIGCRYEGILEISVVDNGVSFPLYVIETFGKRGVTTGGMGNGIADLVDFAKEINASISLDEFDGRTNSFTKKISIIFDKKGINNFNSARREHVTGPFWSTI